MKRADLILLKYLLKAWLNEEKEGWDKPYVESMITHINKQIKELENGKS